MERVIEALESRIAPAAVFTYTDSDGDTIAIKTSARITNVEFADYLATHAYFDNGDLVGLDLSNPIFRNTTLSISSTQTVGDGLASVGEIYASVDLRKVTIGGSLGAIGVGDSNTATPALNILQVQTLGGSEASSYFNGKVNAIKVLGDLTGGINGYGFEIFGGGEGTLGNIGTLNVGGSITSEGSVLARNIGTLKVGGDLAGAVAARNLNSVRIDGDIVGGEFSGGLLLGGSIKSLRVGGSIIAGEAAFSGGVVGLSLGNVSVGGSITGGNQVLSGFIAGFEFGKLTIKNDVTGGAGDVSGAILALGDVNSIRVGGSLISGEGAFSGSILAQSLYGIEGILDAVSGGQGGIGEIFEGFPLALGSLIGGDVGKIVIGGSLVGSSLVDDGEGGTVEVTGVYGGSISVLSLGSLRIGGDIVGGSGDYSGSVSGNTLTNVIVGGDIRGGAGFNSAIIDFNSIGNVRVFENVIGGTGLGSASIVGDHGIGSVRIDGNLQGGAHQSGSIAAFEGDIDSVVIGGSLSNQLPAGFGYTGIYAGGSLNRVTIGGGVSGGDYGTLGIRAGYEFTPSAAVPSIGSVTIKGDASNFMLEAGVALDGSVYGSATIGSVNITGNFIKSSISAGIGAGEDGFYGTSDDEQGYADFGLISRIANVVIGGAVSGTPANESLPEDPVNLDNYGIFAQHIVALKVGGAKQALQGGATNDLIARALAADVNYKEIPILV